ncbi:MAG: extracellular solute-binding protein, partial [Aristaeellaceae bacterium]
MKKLVALLVALMMFATMLPVMAMADSAIDTSEHVVITYLVTGDPPTNRTDEVLAKINEILTEKVNAELKIRWIEWTDWTTKYNLALATQNGDIDLVGTATDWLNAWPNIQKGAFLPLSEEMLQTYAPNTWAQVPQANWDLCKYNGDIYLMPEDNYAQWTNHGFMYRGDWARAAGLENGVHSWEDLGVYFQYIKDNMPDVIPWDANGNGSSYSPQMAGGWQTSHTTNIYIEGIGVDLFYGESKDDPYTLSRYYLEGDEL